MKLSDTPNVYPLNLKIGKSVDGPVIELSDPMADEYYELCLDKTTAAEFLPILQHFIATGELPE